MAIKVGELFALLTLDDQLTRALAQAKARAQAAGAKIEGDLDIDLTGDLSGLLRALQAAQAKAGSAGDAAGESFGAGMADGAQGASSGLMRVVENLNVPLVGAGVVLGGLLGAALVGAVGEVIERDMAASLTAAAVATEGRGSEVAGRFGRVAGQLYASNFGESVQDNLDAIEAIVTTQDWEWNLGDDQLRQAAEQALNFATIFDTDIAESVQKAGVLVKNGMAKDWTEAWDLMTRTMQLVPKHMRDDVFDATDEYTRFLKEMGFTGKEAFNVIRKASSDQFTMDKSIDAIKEFQIRATDMSATSVEAYDILGLAAEDTSRTIAKGGPAAKAAFNQIIDRLTAIKDPLKQRTAAVGLFGTQFEDLGNIDAIAALRPMTEGFGTVAGAAAEAGRVATDNLGSAVESIKRKLEPGSLLAAFTSGGAEGLFSQLTAAKDEAVAVWDRYGPEARAAAERGWAEIQAWWTDTGKPWLISALTTFWDEQGPAIVAAADKWWSETGAPGIGNAISSNVSPIAAAAFWGAMQSMFSEENVADFRRGSDMIVAEVLDPIGGALQTIADKTGFVGGALVEMFEEVGSGLGDFFSKWGEPLGWLIDRLEDLAGLLKDTSITGLLSKAFGGDLPGIPGFDEGGIIPGPRGKPRLVLAHGGETVLPTHRMDFGGSADTAGPASVRSEQHTWNVTGQRDPRSTAWHLRDRFETRSWLAAG